MADDLTDRSEALGKRIDEKQRQLDAASPMLPSERTAPGKALDENDSSKGKPA